MSGKSVHLPRHLARGGRVPAHIGEALLPPAVGNPEGSLRDPLTTDPKGEVRRAAGYPQIYAADNTPALVKNTDAYGCRALTPWYVTGLAEGEGCFCVAFAVRPRLRARIEVRPSFSLSLNEKDVGLLHGVQAFFGCGWIRESKGDRTFKFEARSLTDLTGTVVPHFERFPLAGAKARSFSGFAEVCRMIEQGNHRTSAGLREIVGLAYGMNLGKRRRSKHDLLRVLDEVKG